MLSINEVREILKENNKEVSRHYEVGIFCMGEFGIDLYFKLKEFEVNVDYFIDNDPSKKGYALNNIYCISMAELLKRDTNKLIIVAKKNPRDIIDFLEKQGIRDVTSKENVLVVLEENNLLKNVGNEISDFDIDYSKAEIVTILNQFREQVFTILNGDKDSIGFFKEESLLEKNLNNVLANTYRYYEENYDEGCRD